MKTLRYVLFLIVLALPACALTPEQQLREGYRTASSVVKATTVLTNRDAISVDEAERVSSMAKTSKVTLDAGSDALKRCRAIEGAKCDGAIANINLGSGVLMELENFLKKREATK